MSTLLSGPTTARNSRPGVVPTCVDLLEGGRRACSLCITERGAAEHLVGSVPDLLIHRGFIATH
jgi:hypothetical protein